ncbi:MAG: LD-carboxypeptidase [Muribaculaceae bacterium]|nr:LD-carboxypeptidase [Muribaculaceae bacterium]
MKRFYLLTLLFSLITVCSQAKAPVAPPFLAPGDSIAILSLSSTPKNHVPESGAKALEQWGFTPVVSENVLASYRTFAGTPELRRDELMRALRDPSIKAILSTRGGYGAANVLALLHPDSLARYPKWIIGYSDITGYLSAEVMAGNMGIHANMCGRLADTKGNDSASIVLKNILLGDLPHYHFAGHELNHEGEAAGILIGGNMSVYGDLAGSPFDFLNDEFLAENDVILFIEDVGESYAKIDRMFQYLILRGVLSKIKALIVGRFDDCPPSRGYANVFEMLDEYVKPYDIPICYDFPTGHDENHNYPLIEGCPAVISVSKTGVTLDFVKQ